MPNLYLYCLGCRSTQSLCKPLGVLSARLLLSTTSCHPAMRLHGLLARGAPPAGKHLQQQASCVPSRAAAAPSRSTQPCLESCSGRKRGSRCGRVAAGFEADPDAELEDEDDMEDIDLEEGTQVTFMTSAGEEG